MLGALLSATAPSAGLFIAGRIILGVSTGLLRVVAVPPLLQRFPVEPPHDRGVHQYRGLRTIPHTGPPRPASRR